MCTRYSEELIFGKAGNALLRVVKTVKQNFDIPVAAYQVSGEFSMIHAAAERVASLEEAIINHHLF